MRRILLITTLLVLLVPLAGPVLADGDNQAVFARPVLVVNTGFLNVRSGPSAQFAAVATVPGGTELGVLGTAGDGVWYQVALPNGQAGWVNVEFTIPRGDFTNVPLVGSSSVQVIPNVPSTGNAVPVVPPNLARSVVVVNTSALNVRTGPGARFATVFTAAGGTEFPVLGVTPDLLWYFVETPAGPGWVASEFVLFRGDPEVTPIISYESIPEGELAIQTPVVVVNTSFLNVRSGPGAQFTQVTTVRGGTELPVLGLASDGVWFLVRTPAGDGWVNNEFVLFRGTFEVVPIIELSEAGGVIQTPVALIGNSAQLYAAPGTNFGLLGSVVGPVEAPIVARTSDFDWVQINTSVGFGWVLASDVLIRGDVNLIPIVNAN